MTPRRRSTYSMPGSSGADDFRAKQEPAFEPVDDLSRFVLDRIREAETEPVADGVDAFKSPGDAAAYRYAQKVRLDCVAFRRITAAYCEQVARGSSGVGDPVLAASLDGMADGLQTAVLAVANRFDAHPDFKDGWRLS